MGEWINGKKVVEGYTEGARVYNSGAITIDDNTTTLLTFDSERRDTDSMHSTVANTGRITFNTGGVYAVGAHIRWNAGTGLRQIIIRLNGSIFIANDHTIATGVGSTHGLHINTTYYFSVGDYIEFRVYQNSGGQLDITSIGNYTPEVYAQRIG